jgi:hypothetical protein
MMVFGWMATFGRFLSHWSYPKPLKTSASLLFLVFRFKSVYESKLSTHPLNEKPALFVRAL